MIRSRFFDAVKGLAILLVIFAHSLQRNMIDFTNLWYWISIHHFHMAVFIFISGYLSAGKLNLRWLQRRFVQLIPPFIVWSIALYYWSALTFSGLDSYPVKGGPIYSCLYVMASLNLSGLWFFPALFSLCIIMYIAKGKLKLLFGFTLLLYLLSQLPFPDGMRALNDGFSKVAWFLPIFSLGYIFAKYSSEMVFSNSLIYMALILFPLVFCFGSGNIYLFPIYNWGNWNAFLSVLPYYKFILSILGIAFIFALTKVMIKIEIIQKYLCYLGTITFGLYPMHLLYLKLVSGNGLSIAIFTAIFSLLCSIVLIIAAQKFRLTNYLMLGKLPQRMKIK